MCSYHAQRGSSHHRRRGALAPAIQQQGSGQKKRVKHVGDLLAWATQQGAYGLDNIYVSDSKEHGAGLGVFAAHTFKEGDVIMSMDMKSCLFGEESCDTHALSTTEHLAAALLSELHSGHKSSLTLYLSTLPTPEDLACHPHLWPQGVRPDNLLKGSPRGVRQARLARMRGAASTKLLLDQKFAKSAAEARWALAIVESRAMLIGRFGDRGGLALCPVMDLLNHTATLQASSCELTVENSCGKVSFVAERPIDQFEELCYCYDYGPGADFFATFGFVPSTGGACDLQVPSSSLIGPTSSGGTHAGEARLKLLTQRGWWPGALTGRPLLLRLPDNARPGGLLLGIARLSVLNTAQRVAEVGPSILPLEDSELEQKAGLVANNWILRAVERLETQIQMLSQEPVDGLLAGTSETLRRMASQLLAMEKKTLMQCVETLLQ